VELTAQIEVVRANGDPVLFDKIVDAICKNEEIE